MRELTVICALIVSAILATNPAYLLPALAGMALVVVLVIVVALCRGSRSSNDPSWSEESGWGDLGNGLEDHWDYSRRDSDETQGGV